MVMQGLGSVLCASAGERNAERGHRDHASACIATFRPAEGEPITICLRDIGSAGQFWRMEVLEERTCSTSPFCVE